MNPLESFSVDTNNSCPSIWLQKGPITNEAIFALSWAWKLACERVTRSQFVILSVEPMKYMPMPFVQTNTADI